MSFEGSVHFDVTRTARGNVMDKSQIYGGYHIELASAEGRVLNSVRRKGIGARVRCYP